jgi:hypothetical protein
MLSFEKKCSIQVAGGYRRNQTLCKDGKHWQNMECINSKVEN